MTTLEMNKLQKRLSGDLNVYIKNIVVLFSNDYQSIILNEKLNLLKKILKEPHFVNIIFKLSEDNFDEIIFDNNQLNIIISYNNSNNLNYNDIINKYKSDVLVSEVIKIFMENNIELFFDKRYMDFLLLKDSIVKYYTKKIMLDHKIYNDNIPQEDTYYAKKNIDILVLKYNKDEINNIIFKSDIMTIIDLIKLETDEKNKTL